MWDYSYVSMCAGDVAACGGSDRAIVDRHLRWGYVAYFYSSVNHFKENLILSVDQKSYND